jgi:predicted transcriptional regulator
MTIVELHLDDQTYERVKHIAAGRRVTVEALIQDLVQRLVAIETTDDPILGMFSQEPELMDAVVRSGGAA